MDGNHASCCASCRQNAKYEVLYEYVRGLQEANKCLDVGIAERVMKELADSLTSPASAALVVASGGARLIASAVKQFKSHGLSKTSLSRKKLTEAVTTSSIAKKIDSEIGMEVGTNATSAVDDNEQSQSFCDPKSNIEQNHSSRNGSGCTGTRRKRHRTIEDDLEFDDCKENCTCKNEVQSRSSALDVVVASSTNSEVIGSFQHYRTCAGRSLSTEKHLGSQSSTLDVNVCACRSSNAGYPLQSCSHGSASQNSMALVRNKDRNTHQENRNTYNTNECLNNSNVEDTNNLGCVNSSSVGDAKDVKCVMSNESKQSLVDNERHRPNEKIEYRSFLNVLNDMYVSLGPNVLQDRSTGVKDNMMSKKESENKLNKECNTTVSRSFTEVVSKAEPICVLDIAKAAGLSDVAAAACYALDKLLSVALQGKVSSVANNTVAVPHIGGRRRGKILPAELYVALTEALIDLVHVLKDQLELLCWCLDCLGSILPPPCNNQTAYDGFLTSGQTGIESFFSTKDTLHMTGCKSQGTAHGKITICHHCNGHSKKSATITARGSTSSDVACDNTCSSGAAATSMSAFAAVAYTATVPMLAEKAVKAILNAIQPCDIEPHSTQAALHALSAHLSLANSKYLCDDAIAFIIATMREFKTNPEIQTESCVALSALNRVISSATGHCAWTTVLNTMDVHSTNVAVQRAGCNALHSLCTKTGLGVVEWGNGKRPLKAGRDTDREAGAHTLISAMLSFPEDVRIQWHGCSALWNLIHSAGSQSVANMVASGALSAVVGAMRVCRTNEVMQQEGCNVIGTMARTLVESNYDFRQPYTLDPSKVDEEPSQLASHSSDEKQSASLDSPMEWQEALKVVVTGLKAFSKSRSVQSNGIFALSCILKGSLESINLGTSGSARALVDAKPSMQTDDTNAPPRHDNDKKKQSLLGLRKRSLLGKEIADDIERITEAVEVTMAAMPEYPKVETIQVWGCAVLQQAFLAYIHFSKHITNLPYSGAVGSASSVSAKISPLSSLANLVLSQATSAMFMISGMMALSFSGDVDGGEQQGNVNASHQKALSKATPMKSAGVKSQSCPLSDQSTVSVRQSWCAVLGAIGDVFGHLAPHSELMVEKGLLGPVRQYDAKNIVVNGNNIIEVLKETCTEEKVMSNEVRGAAVTDVNIKSPNRSLIYPNARAFSALKHIYLNDRIDMGTPSCTSVFNNKEQELLKTEWTGVGNVSKQQVLEDIKIWQGNTMSLIKIAERVGFPMSVKNAVLAIRTVLYKHEDAETVIWACHALVNLYLTWENVHLLQPGLEDDPEQFKSRIWGDGEVGLRQLAYLVTYWTKQNRVDVVSLVLQALYSACVFAATIREIEEVFTSPDGAIEAVIAAIQKALSPGCNICQRKKVVEQAYCVLGIVCSYSIPVQVGFASAGGADIVLSAMDRYDTDDELLLNGLHALGLDCWSRADFDAFRNLALCKSTSAHGTKAGRKKKGALTTPSFSGSLLHVLKEGCLLLSGSRSIYKNGDFGNAPEHSEHNKIPPQLEKLVVNSSAQSYHFLTWLIAGPGSGCSFAVECLRRSNLITAQNSSLLSEMQGHICLVVGYICAHKSKWRQDFLEAGGLEAILVLLEGLYNCRIGTTVSVPVLMNGKDEKIQFCIPDFESSTSTAQEDVKLYKKYNCLGYGFRDTSTPHIQYSACIALAGLFKDGKATISRSINSLIKCLILVLHQYGGLSHLNLHIPTAEKIHPEVCAPARLALARLGVSRVGEVKDKGLAHEAALEGDLASLKALDERGVDLTTADGTDHSPLWYAEQSGHLNAVQFLREHAQLSSKRKCREKSKNKNKKVLAKDNSLITPKQTRETDMLLPDNVNVHKETPSGQASSRVCDKERKLQVLQERNSRKEQANTGEITLKDSFKSTDSKENIVAGLGSQMSVTVAYEKQDKESKKVKKKQQRTKKDMAPSSEHQVDPQPSTTNSTIDTPKAHVFGKGPQTENRICEVDKHVSASAEDDNSGNRIQASEYYDQTVGGVADNSGSCTKSAFVNKVLHDALVSGNVKNLEDALELCKEPDSGADMVLLKKVRAALAKRLKRVEKLSFLEQQLLVAMEEGNGPKLLAAISEIEKTPRFAASFSERLTEAKKQLHDIESKEGPTVRCKSLRPEDLKQKKKPCSGVKRGDENMVPNRICNLEKMILESKTQEGLRSRIPGSQLRTLKSTSSLTHIRNPMVIQPPLHRGQLVPITTQLFPIANAPLLGHSYNFRSKDKQYVENEDSGHFSYFTTFPSKLFSLSVP